MKVKYPDWADNKFKKYLFLIKLHQKLTLAHNIMGAKFRNGEITRVQWTAFKNLNSARSFAVTSEKISVRQEFRDDNSFILGDIGNYFET